MYELWNKLGSLHCGTNTDGEESVSSTTIAADASAACKVK
jgi:hypothetical protein